MDFFKQAERFTVTQKALHWAVVVLLAAQYFLFDGMGRPFHQLMETGTASYSAVPVLHIAIGILVLALAAWRLVLRLSHGSPAEPEAEPALARLASKIAHAAIYVLLFVLPLTGLAAWFGQIGPAAGLHETLTNLLMALVILHVAAALVHQFWWKTDVLARMR
ncbi:cytochrome b [Poseidonocella sp. HB161398]|uniref:cytochrome b n=1 Tax=Poseidonocella sp. HB161398 TaxID=2320855 RepID=UPI001108DC07|nr:cytochrome b/b6 domain-containing protein [Poseidonocella sp. HB161398]